MNAFQAQRILKRTRNFGVAKNLVWISYENLMSTEKSLLTINELIHLKWLCAITFIVNAPYLLLVQIF